MAITVKHNKVSTIPDTDDTSLVRPSDWNADHTLVGTIDVANGGTGASTLTGYVKGNGTSAMTAVATVPSTDITGLGTMSTQNATAVAITGGTINGTTIGATTPSTVNATTITGQTARVNGTGQNLLTNTVSLATTWTQTNIAVTGSQTDPFGGSSAFSINTGTNTGQHTFFQSTSYASNSFTLSLYAKAGTANFVGLYSSAQNAGVIFNINTGAFSANINNAPTSSAITAVGSGWYRCSIVLTGAQTFSQFFVSEDGTNLSFTGTSKTIFVYGLQLEIGSTLNTYVPTTSAIVYGTPTLSFSGVSTIGLESNGSLFVQPAGTGALQAQATTSTTAGGNARGTYAVDWQTLRGSAGQVASGVSSVLSGGLSNVASSNYGTISGGRSNTASGGGYSYVGGGFTNTASSPYSVATGGYLNTSAGYFNFIGGGFTNSGTSGSAVTTQSGTMNGTTAVTLSGSNANIKVGQYITGTSIANDTYVAAISGTSLTLSQNASGSSTSTLSFFTPHGVVVGGGNNQATGAYSAILGGGDAGSSANRNVASGDWSAVAGGWKNTASSNYSFVGGGGGNSATTGFGSVVCGGGFFGNLPTQFSGNAAQGTSAFVGAGFSNIASGFGASVVGGNTNYATSTYSAILGGYAGTTRGITGYQVFPAHNGPVGTTQGSSQAALLIIGAQTTDATATALRSETAAAGTTNQVILPNNSAYLFKATVISNVTGGGNTSAWKLEGAIKRGANAASTAIVGTVTTTLLAADAGAATWAIAATADTTNGGLRITFTGQASTTIRTVCKVETTEVTF
jgi:hypothetical protein